MRSVPLGRRQSSAVEDPRGVSRMMENQSAFSLDGLGVENDHLDEMDDFHLQDMPQGSEEDSDNDSLEFELYGTGVSREKLVHQLEGAGEVDFSTFLLDHYKYWSTEDLSEALGDILKGLDVELIDLVNSNYLHYINLDKSIDGSLDLAQDVKMDLVEYGKLVKKENDAIEKDTKELEEMRQEKRRLLQLRYTCEGFLRLGEMVECFEGLLAKFDGPGAESEMLGELCAMYLGIAGLISNLSHLESAHMSPMFASIGRKMHGLRLEFTTLLGKNAGKSQTQVFEAFKAHQVLGLGGKFRPL